MSNHLPMPISWAFFILLCFGVFSAVGVTIMVVQDIRNRRKIFRAIRMRQRSESLHSDDCDEDLQ